MTDKEQIIIDVIACKNYNNGTCQEGYCSGSVANIISCDPQNIRCDFYIDRIEEQLTRKTQECEELKDARFNLNCEIYSLNRYRKALDEIEKILKDEICEECPGKEGCKAGCKEHQCLDIINKAQQTMKEVNND